MNDSNNTNVTSLKLEEMEKSIFLSRPQLKKIKETYGELSYFDYVKKKNRVNLHKDFNERKNEVIDVITSETTRLLGSTIASEVKNQLKKNDSLSTAEHTAPLGTAQTLNAGLSQALSMFNTAQILHLIMFYLFQEDFRSTLLKMNKF
jgi:tryptophan 2,3-dioxygenase